MVKRHLKSIAAPRTWRLKRKEDVFTTRPNPGSHKLDYGISINHVLKKELKVCSITKETKLILNNDDCLVNSRPVKDIHYIVGLMDVVSLPKLKKNYRVIIDSKGYLNLIEIPDKEAGQIYCKITNKTKVKKGIIQLNTLNSRNILINKNDKDKKNANVKNDYQTNGTLIYDTKDGKIVEYFPFQEGSTVLLIGGNHIGQIGKVEKIEGNNIIFKRDDKTYQTLKKFVFVVGKDNPELKIA